MTISEQSLGVEAVEPPLELDSEDVVRYICNSVSGLEIENCWRMVDKEEMNAIDSNQFNSLFLYFIQSYVRNSRGEEFYESNIEEIEISADRVSKQMGQEFVSILANYKVNEYKEV
jgi:hypothetical protein